MDAEPITLRAHQVLCLQGFQGLGYSEGFVREMTAVQSALREMPAREVELIGAPDRLCAVCPHLRHGGCVLQGPEHETHMRAHDLRVLDVLGLAEGAVLPWKDVVARIGTFVRGADLPRICTTCPWLPLGLCAAAMDRVPDAEAEPAMRGPERTPPAPE